MLKNKMIDQQIKTKFMILLCAINGRIRFEVIRIFVIQGLSSSGNKNRKNISILKQTSIPKKSRNQNKRTDERFGSKKFSIDQNL